MEILIGIDIGTGSTKAVAYSINDPKIITTAQEFYTTDYLNEKHEQDPEILFQSFLIATKRLVDQLNEEAEIKGVVFSCAMHSLIVIGDDGLPITKCMIWSDHRSSKQAKEILDGDFANEIYLATGTPIHPMAPLSKIKYLFQKDSVTFENAGKFIGIKEYIFYRLFDTFIVDYSIASATGLFDIKKLEWHQTALEAAHISSSYLSDPKPTTFQLSGLRQKEAEFLGLKSSTPFILGGGDGPLANLGSIAIQQNLSGCLTLGTSGAVRITVPKPIDDKQHRIFNYIIDNNLYVAGGAVNNGGIVMSWLEKVFQESADESLENLFSAAANVDAGSNGLLFIPWIMGERAPVWDAEAKGMYTGVSFYHTREHFIRASMEGVCFNLKYILNTLETLSEPIDTINFNGGLSKSPFVCQLLSDILDKKVIKLPDADLSAYGAIILGLKSLGIITSFKEMPLLSTQLVHYEPNPSSRKSYQKLFNLYAGIVDQHLKN